MVESEDTSKRDNFIRFLVTLSQLPDDSFITMSHLLDYIFLHCPAATGLIQEFPEVEEDLAIGHFGTIFYTWIDKFEFEVRQLVRCCFLKQDIKNVLINAVLDNPLEPHCTEALETLNMLNNGKFSLNKKDYFR